MKILRVLLLFTLVSFSCGKAFAASFGYIMITDPNEVKSNYTNVPQLNSIISVSKSQIIFRDMIDIQNVAIHYKKTCLQCSELTLAQSQANYISDKFGKKCGLSSSGLVSNKNYDVLSDSSQAKVLSYYYLGSTNCGEDLFSPRGLIFALIMFDDNEIQ